MGHDPSLPRLTISRCTFGLIEKCAIDSPPPFPFLPLPPSFLSLKLYDSMHCPSPLHPYSKNGMAWSSPSLMDRFLLGLSLCIWKVKACFVCLFLVFFLYLSPQLPYIVVVGGDWTCWWNFETVHSLWSHYNNYVPVETWVQESNPLDVQGAFVIYAKIRTVYQRKCSAAASSNGCKISC